MNESKNGLGFAIARQYPRRGYTVMRRQRLMQLLILNIRITLGAGEILNHRLFEAFRHAQRVNIGAEIQQLIGTDAQQSGRFASIAAVSTL